ncbi:MAG: transketolase [Bacteroidetes bacterium]|nr:transketolase [Bacteroidota bacterium]
MNQQRFLGDPDYNKLQDLARQLRRDAVRMIHHAGSGHIGGSLGLAEYMAVLYGYALQYDSENIADPERDRLILSNGHTCAIWYAALSRSSLIPIEELSTFRKLGSRLQGHPARKAMPELVETSTGPLGQGFSVANGIALSLKLRKSKGNVYCILGDGELQEGQVWEAFMTAAHYKLNNITVFINYNKLQIDGTTAEVMNIDPLSDRLKAFGWYVSEIDGHNLEEIIEALQTGLTITDKPKVIIGNTLMGKGVSYMENLAAWHGTCPSDEQTVEALEQIGCSDLYQDFPISDNK